MSSDISTFVARHRKQSNDISVDKDTSLLPWYMKPIFKSDFISRKAKDGKYYVRHKEWAKEIWIGGYDTIKDVDKIIDSYVKQSSIAPLNRITSSDEIHSVYISNEKTFF